MLIKKPEQCPICNGEWIVNKSPTAYPSCTDYACINWGNCKLELRVMSTAFFMMKSFSGGGEVWWCSNGPAEMRLARDGFKKLTFDPPFDIDEARLRLLILFS